MTFLKLGLYLFLMLMIGCVRQLTSQRMNAPATAETPPELATAGKAFAAAIEKLGQGEQADAEDFLDGALQNFPDDQRLVFLRGVCERSRFSIRGAMPYFGKTVTLNPTTTEALCANLVMRLDMRKNSAENFNALRLLVAGHPDDVLLQWMLAVQCRAYTNKLEGIAHYREVCKHFDTPPVLVHQTMGNLLDGACLYDEARPCRDIALRQERAGWTLNAMGALFIDQRRYTDAVAYFAEAVAVSPRVNYHWQNQVRNLLALRRWEEALEQVEQGLRQFPDDEKLRWQKAQALEELGRHEEAARAFLACGGHDAHGRARNIFLLTGRADEARKLLPISQPLPPYEKRPPAEQLIWAAMAGDAEKVRALLAAGDASLRASLDLGRTIQPPGFTPRRYTALIVAAWQGHATVVELLLKNGASPDAADNNRCTPLMYAAQWHQNQVIERLLAGGAKLDLRCQWGETALFLATVHRNVIGARLLLKAGANPALSKVAEGALNCVVNHEDLELLELMHQRMDCFEQPAPKTGRNTLMHVIVHGYWHVCDQLLAWQAQVNRADAEGQTPLMLAMRGRGTGLWGEWSPAYAHSLVEHGADVNAENHAGQTALDLAALVGADDLVAYLKQHGAQRGVPRFPRWICDEQINTEARRRAVAMVAPLAAKECGEVSAFGTSARRVFPDLNMHLTDVWRVRDATQLRQRLDVFEFGGDRMDYATLLKTPLDEQLARQEPARYLRAQQAQAAAAGRPGTDPAGADVLAWDLLRQIQLCSLSMARGHLDPQDGWQRIERAQLELEKQFSSWDELAASFRRGQKLYAAVDTATYDEIFKLFANRSDPNNPWVRVAWPTKPVPAQKPAAQ